MSGPIDGDAEEIERERASAAPSTAPSHSSGREPLSYFMVGLYGLGFAMLGFLAWWIAGTLQ